MSDLPDYLKVPEVLKAHPELIGRNLILEYPLSIGSVYATSGFNPPQFVVKVLSPANNPANEEDAIIERLRHVTDFESYQQFQYGPGIQTAITLPNTHVLQPLEMTTFDPFSWEVYYLRLTFETMFVERFLSKPQAMP